MVAPRTKKKKKQKQAAGSWIVVVLTVSVVVTAFLVLACLSLIKNHREMTHKKEKRILLTGASGYLGQHLLYHLLSLQEGNSSNKESMYHVTALHHSTPALADAVAQRWTSSSATQADGSSSFVEVIQLDLTDAAAVTAFFSSRPAYDVCLHTAALSSPAVCETQPQKAANINHPTAFFQALLQSNQHVTLIALSTDQVYDGAKPLYRETDPADPCNVYGRTKKQMEETLLEMAKERGTIVVLRSSIILGPKAPLLPDAAHATFLHFIASRGEHETTTFFTDERRSVVSVRDVVAVIQWLIEHRAAAAVASGVYNMGGPESVSRHDMALAVFEHAGYDTARVQAALKAELAPGPVCSPLDISMDSTQLVKLTGRQFLSLQDMVKDTFATMTTTRSS